MTAHHLHQGGIIMLKSDTFISRLNPDRRFLLKHIGFDKPVVQASGHYFYDEQGQAYLDFLSQYGAVPFGHNPPFLWKTFDDINLCQAPALVQPLLSPAAEMLAAELSAVAPCDEGYVTFTNSGAETVEAAIKLARAHTQRPGILSAHNGFHGKTLGSVSATWNPKYREPFLVDTSQFDFIPYGDLESLDARLSRRDVGAFLVEPIQGEAGMLAPPAGYLKDASEICRKYGTLFILDEIQTGLGRTGRLFAAEHEGVRADIVLVAKALGGGLVPLGACICGKHVWNEDFGLFHSSTFSNNHLTCSIGLAVLRQLLADDRALVRAAAENGAYLRDGLENLVRLYPEVYRKVTGAGLMQGLHLVPWHGENGFFVSLASSTGMSVPILCGYLLHKHRILTAPAFNNSQVLRIEPALTISRTEIDLMLAALDDIGVQIANSNFCRLFSFVTDAPDDQVCASSQEPHDPIRNVNHDITCEAA
jgi:acetylornithine/succinyldiaminopimelate/putrescine aminotransferase